MTKIFKRTFAFFIAVIMMISSFPYMALAEDTASATEGSTTAEMTTAELKAYIDENIGLASVKLPAETPLKNVTTDFYKGIVKHRSWIYPNSDLSKEDNYYIYSKYKTDNYIKFSLIGLNYAVAVYTGENNDIRFPVTANLYANSTKYNDPIFSLYIKNISIIEAQSNFQFGNEWWDRCQGENNLNSPTKNDPQVFSSKTNGDRLYKNSFNSGERKIWRNYIIYTGNGNTDSYYEKLPKKFQFVLQYESNKSTETPETKELPLSANMYVLNMKPYKDIVDKLKTDYEAVKSDESKYTPKALNNYYKAVYDIINFDITPYLSEVTTEGHVVTAASAVKTVVENYNSAKGSLLDFTAYDAAKENCDTIIKNQSENAEYEKNSFAEFKKIYDDVTAKAKTVKTQEALDDLTAQLITAQTMLRKNKFSITVNIYKNSDLIDTKYYHDELYGYKFNIDVASYVNEAKGCVKRWVIYTDGGKTRTVVGTTDSIFALYITKEAVVDVYIVPLEENVNPEEYSKVVFYGFNGRVIDVKYLKKGDTLTSDKYTKAPDVPFYDFAS